VGGPRGFIQVSGTKSVKIWFEQRLIGQKAEADFSMGATETMLLDY
jgi:hypothetical protein